MNRNTLKLIAIVAMVIDHVAWAFVPTSSVAGQVMHAIGRLTGPIMFYFIGEGYIHTRSLKNYITRMAIFAAISNFAFGFFQTGELTFFPCSVIFTLLLGILAIHAYNQIQQPTLRWTVIVGLCLLSMLGDWPIIGVVMCLGFYIYRNNFKDMAIFVVICQLVLSLLTMVGPLDERGIYGVVMDNLWGFGVVFVLPLLYSYNGEKGRGKYSNWFFYIFYPLHLFVIGGLRYFILIS
ncbi:MAG TPA: pilus assembly protein [Candidatus Merdenecus merdavium]|nr:pilus assembly protein [Candidatus Merdenecus merdavium]